MNTFKVGDTVRRVRNQMAYRGEIEGVITSINDIFLRFGPNGAITGGWDYRGEIRPNSRRHSDRGEEFIPTGISEPLPTGGHSEGETSA